MSILETKQKYLSNIEHTRNNQLAIEQQYFERLEQLNSALQIAPNPAYSREVMEIEIYHLPKIQAEITRLTLELQEAQHEVNKWTPKPVTE